MTESESTNQTEFREWLPFDQKELERLYLKRGYDPGWIAYELRRTEPEIIQRMKDSGFGIERTSNTTVTTSKKVFHEPIKEKERGESLPDIG